MSQTAAIFLDAYRELNARRLFWITLVLSGLVVGTFALVGINERGISVLFWTLPFGINTETLSPEVFYKSLFTDLGIGMWLSLAATILALVSTAGIIPDLVASGSIDMMLSKPISRVRLFLTKYATGLLFVTLQVTVFCLGSFLVIGVRGGAWEPAIFLGVPLVVCFYSYLFAICAVLGLLTGSTIAALLLTILAWIAVFLIHTGESIFNVATIASDQEVQLIERDIERRERMLATATRRPTDDDAAYAARMEALRGALEKRRTELDEAVSGAGNWRKAHGLFMVCKTLLPKTGETIGLLERSLIDLADLPDPPAPPQPPPITPAGALPDINVSIFDPSVVNEAVVDTRQRSVAWIVGTSLGFEAFLLAIGSWVFWRKDF